MRKICVFTGTRAEYGLLKPLMEEIYNDKKLELQIVASGMHLSPEFGLTYKEIEKDGFNINEKVEILLSSDTTIGISKSVGLGLISFSESLERLKPDIVIILGDRFEALAFVIASYAQRIPIAHLSGGESTQGVIDDGIRHAITKFSYIHFTATEEYRKRVIQLGEHPKRVFNVGEVGLDNIKSLIKLTQEDVENELNFKFSHYNFLITFHPETLEYDLSEKHFKEILLSLDWARINLKDVKFIFTKPNADAEGRKIAELIDEFVFNDTDASISFISMGRFLYLNAMNYVDCVIGNSSSGIVEAPSLKKPSIDVGERQRGRVKAESIIWCAPIKDQIVKAIKKSLSPEFLQIVKNVQNPYEQQNSAKKIKNIIKKLNIINIKKEFFDISFETRR